MASRNFGISKMLGKKGKSKGVTKNVGIWKQVKDVWGSNGEIDNPKELFKQYEKEVNKYIEEADKKKR